MAAPAPSTAVSESLLASSPSSAACVAPSSVQRAHPDRAPQRRILTGHRLDDGSIFVYQAYKPSIGLEAVKRQNFAGIPGFSTTRMTSVTHAETRAVTLTRAPHSLCVVLDCLWHCFSWIKFSLGWMLYRCNYAQSRDQEVVLRIRLSAAAVDTILRAAVGSTWNRRLYPTKSDWQAAMARSEVRFQWDPERDLSIVKFPHNQRALQLGLAKTVATRFATDPTWILSIEDCTAQAKAIKMAVDAGTPMPEVPLEQAIPIDDAELRRSLAMDLAAGEDEQEEEAPAK